MLKYLVFCLMLGVSSAYAQTTEQSSKIEGYGVLNRAGPQASKIEGYGVLNTNGLRESKTTGYAVLGVGPQLSKLEGYAVLNSTVPFASIGTSKLEEYAVLNPTVPFSSLGSSKLESYGILSPGTPTPFTPPPCTAPTLDGVASGQNTFIPPVLSLTTTKPDIIFLHISTLTFAANHTDPPADIGSIIDGTGLVWTRRGVRQTYTVSDETFKTAAVDEFWTYAPAPLNSDSITWTYGAGTLSFSLGVAFGVPGVNSPTVPFDTNLSLPAIGGPNVNPGFSQPQVTLSTTNANDLIFVSCTSQAIAGLCSTVAPVGWNYIAGAGLTAVSGDLQTNMYYKRVGSRKLSEIENVDGSSVHNWLAIGDAFAGGGGGSGCNTRPWVWIEQ